MEFELINPSDPYTFMASSNEVAALTVFLIGSAYGANAKDDSFEVPITMFGGGAEWYQEQFGHSTDDGLTENKEEVTKALEESMMYGGFEDRNRYQAALNAIDDDEKREKFIAEWQDGRSSLNDIGNYCHALAKKLLKTDY